LLEIGEKNNINMEVRFVIEKSLEEVLTFKVNLEELPRKGDCVIHPILPIKAFYRVKNILICYDKIGGVMWKEIYLTDEN